MGWETLLDELWSYAESDPKELVTKIRSCLKGHSSEELLHAISLLITQGQHATARTLLTELLISHQATDDIQRRLELILHFKKHRVPQVLSIKSKQRSKEVLLKDVNDLVASAKLQAAESLLLEAIDAFEDPDFLNLLSRIYMLQRRPIDGAKAMQRALLLRRQQQAFVDKAPDEFIQEDLPIDSDLAFLNGSAESLSALEIPSTQTSNTKTGEVDDSLNFIQIAATHYPPLNTEGWWEVQTKSAPPGTPQCIDGLEAIAALDSSSAATQDEPATPSPSKPVLKLSRPRKDTEAGDGLPKVKVFNKSGRSLTAIQPAALSRPQPSESILPSSQPTLAPEVSASTSESQDEVFDEIDDEEDEDVALTDLGLNISTSPQMDLGLEEQEDDFDLDDDLLDLTIIELVTDHQIETSPVQEDFRDFEDDYAAYAFDPDEVFDGEEAPATEPEDGLSDNLSREDRALQKAAELIGKSNWPLSTLPLIRQIFVMSGWGQTRLALEREIEKGLTPDELILAAHIKVIWSENDMYWIAFDRNGSTNLSYYVLSWPTALLIVRSFDSIPQVEEIEVFLEELFASWHESITLRRAFKSFSRYLWFRFANLEGCLPANQRFDFCDPRELPAEEYSDLGLSDVLEIEKIVILQSYGVFQNKHPQEPGCYFSDLPPVEETPSINAEKRTKKSQIEDTDTSADIEADEESTDDDEAPPEWSASPLSSAVHSQTID